MAYRLPAESETDPAAPVTSELMKALAGNPEGVANGDSGAPSIKDAALDTGAATAAGREWVMKRITSAGVGEVGTYALMATNNVEPGDIVAGSALRFAGAVNSVGLTSSTVACGAGAQTALPSGSWRAMGYVDPVISASDPGESPTIGAVTLFLRVS